MRKTKIIATLGPATFKKNKIHDLLIAGVNVFRINMSHEIDIILLKEVIQWSYDEAKKMDASIAILFDLCGPKIRVGNFKKNDSMVIDKGNIYTLGNKDCNIPLNISLSFSSISENALVKVDDGALSFEIVESSENHISILSHDSGKIFSGKGINFPGINLNLPSVTNKDLKDIEQAVSLGADWIAMSFVRSSDDYGIIKNVLDDHKAQIPIIAKIEKPEAIDDLDGIINAFDGILVARGDLGVEMSLQELPILQKRIVNKCLQRQKPVIIATQMMESMIENSNPTRAEVNDIANAIYDGADAVMLSGETAIGDFPVESVNMMSKIADSVEKDYDLRNFNRYIHQVVMSNDEDRRSICHAAMNLSDDLSLDTIVIMTESGKMAIEMAQYRPKAQIYALCSKKSVFHFLSLIWGINSVFIDSHDETEDMFDFISKLLMRKGYVKKGDKYIITAGSPVGISGSTNMLKIHEVK